MAIDLAKITPLPETAEQTILPEERLEAILGLAVLDKPGVRIGFRKSYTLENLLPGNSSDASMQICNAGIFLDNWSVPELRTAIHERYPNCITTANKVLANYAAFGHESLDDWKTANWRTTEATLPCAILQTEDGSLEVTLTSTTSSSSTPKTHS